VIRYKKRVSFGRGWVGAILLLFLVLGLMATFVQAQLVQHGFHCVTPGVSQEDKETGEGQSPTQPGQLRVDIHHEPGDPTATFKFYNVGSQPCSITDIYIQDGHLCTLLYLIDKDDPLGGPYGDQGVDFSIGATPGNLPDWQYADPEFYATKQFSSDSDPPVSPWGINQGEWLEAIYSVQGGATVYDIEAEVGQGILRIGYHVQSFGDGKSASFVNNLEQIPEPSTVLLLGLGGLALIKKFRK